MQSLSKLLGALNLGEYTQTLADNKVDVEALLLLSDSDLRELGLPLGPRKILLQAIADLRGAERAGVVEDAGAASGVPHVSVAGPAQRRQITVLFCDLVGSTALTQRLDPEELRDLMQAYQSACAEVIATFDGHVAQYLGDGLMVYFGWPKAHEDDPERSVRAGLGLVARVQSLTAPFPLQVRIGIATGLVVVGETGGGDPSVPKAAVGQTPNISARLQALAGPGEIVIAGATHRLLGGLFDYEEVGECSLKGIVEPVRAWRVLGAGSAVGRFEAAHDIANLSPLVGRENELALLTRCWEQVRAKKGQMILLGGEPGIGKSRLAQALREHLADERCVVMWYQCSPRHRYSALHPVVEQLERAAGFSRHDTSGQKLDKVLALLAQGRVQQSETASFIAGLLSLPLERFPPVQISPEERKAKTLAALMSQIEGLAIDKPVLMVLEDAHWVDPSTEELLALLLTRLQTLPVLVVITHRPEYDTDLIGRSCRTPEIRMNPQS